MRRALLAAPVVLVLLSGCGAATETQEGKFNEGSDQAQIAALVDKLSTAGARREADVICTEVLAKQLVDELKAAGGNCVTEMDRAIKDASDYDLQVVDVKVNGATATARVAQGDSDKRATFTFVKERGGWRASALGAS
jgi:nitrous oxide reductase accessory protein NosL